MENKLLADLEARFENVAKLRNLALNSDNGELLGFMLVTSQYKNEFKRRFFTELKHSASSEVCGSSAKSLRSFASSKLPCDFAHNPQTSSQILECEDSKEQDIQITESCHTEGDKPEVSQGLESKNSDFSSLRGEAEAIHKESKATAQSTGSNSQNIALIFNKEAFLDFLNTRMVNKSYTHYLNKIGLSDNAGFLKNQSEVVLNFAFKDCVLKGGASKDEKAKTKELFFNEIIAREEIDVLYAPKILANFELIGGNSSLTQSLNDCGNSAQSFASSKLLSPRLAKHSNLTQDTRITDSTPCHTEPTGEVSQVADSINKNNSQNTDNQSINQSINQSRAA